MATVQTGSRPGEVFATTSHGADTTQSQLPSVAEGSLNQGAVSTQSVREAIATIAAPATASPAQEKTVQVRNQDLVNYAYLVLMKEKGIAASSSYQHAADRMKELFGVSLRDILQQDAREKRSEIPITEENAALVQSRFVRETQPTNAAPQPAPSTTEVSGDMIVNSLYRAAHKLHARMGSEAGRAIGAKDYSVDALVHRLAEIAEIKKHTGHTVWQIALSHREENFSAASLDSTALSKALNAAVAHRSPGGERASKNVRSTPREASRPPETAQAPDGEAPTGKESFHASTTVKPGGALVKTIEDRLVNGAGEEIVVERKRFIAGPLSFNLPGKKVMADEGIHPKEAKAIVKEHLRSLSRRGQSD
jgi:hypothetical protein